MLKSMKSKNQGSGAGRGKAAIRRTKWLQEEENMDGEWKQLTKVKIIFSVEGNFVLFSLEFWEGFLGGGVTCAYVLGFLFIFLSVSEKLLS